MSLPALDSSDTLALGTGKKRGIEGAARGGGGWDGGAGGGLMRRNTGASTVRLFCFL